LALIVASIIVGEDFADVIDWSLYLVDVPKLRPLHYQGNANDLAGGHDIQEDGLAGPR
jgi:hypothetical protein